MPITEKEHLALMEAQREGIDLTIIGPEAPLLDGLADRFREAGLRCLGPTKRKLKLRRASRAMMKKHRIPMAEYAVFADYVREITEQKRTHSITADGLLGKA